MASVISYSKNPPIYGVWHDDGWGGWTDDPTNFKKVPSGYYNLFDDVLIPYKTNATLEPAFVQNVLKELDKAKEFKDTQLGLILGGILTYGNAFSKLLTDFGIIKNPTIPISKDNIDFAEYKKRVESGEIKQSNNTYQPPPPPPVNSTFLGLNFSNPSTIFSIFLGITLIVVLMKDSSDKK